MSSGYIGEIRMFAGNFAPVGWAFCDGQLMPIAGNDALFTLIGTTYGGDGQQTFALPDLRGRVPIHQGTNPNTGTIYQIAQNGGVESVTLTTQQIPAHTHPLVASAAGADQTTLAGNLLAQPSVPFMYAEVGTGPTAALSAASLPIQGGSQPHENRQPILAINFIISLFGVFPTQN